MKRFLSLMLVSYVILIPLFSITAFSAEDEQPIRFVDLASTCSEQSEKRINALIEEISERCKVDLPILTIDGIPEGESYTKYANKYYVEKDYGYGRKEDGVFLLLDIKKDIFQISCYGKAEKRLTKARFDILNDTFAKDTGSDELKTYAALFEKYLNDCSKLLEKTRADGMPYWYSDEYKKDIIKNKPLLVDDAEVFTKKQRQVLESKIKEVRDKHGINFVMFTDNDNHDILREEYATDFLHYNGYGKEYCDGAVIFYLSLEPEKRGVRTIAINSYQENFTPYVIEQIGEVIGDDIRTAKPKGYYEGFLKHIDFIDRLYKGEINKEYDPSEDKLRFTFMIMLFLGPIIGITAGRSRFKKRKKEMQVIAPVYASDYVVDNSYHISKFEEYYLYTTTTRTLRSSSDSSSSGGSSYSSGSSSGESYSGGGFDF